MTDTPTDRECPLHICTHEGRQHSDELLACWFFHILRDGNIRITRTADPQLWDRADVLLDCGGCYDPSRGRFDHHSQSRHPEPPPGRLSGYATAGLVWALHGPEICQKLLAGMSGVWQEFTTRTGEEVVAHCHEFFAAILDREIVAPIDAWDCGIYPAPRTTKLLIPVQWIIPHLPFDHAMHALGRALTQRLRVLADIVAGEKALELDLLENGPGEFYVFGGRVVVKAAPGRRVEIKAAMHFSRAVLELPLLAVMSTLRGGTKWGAFFVDQVPCSRVPCCLESATGGKAFYHEDPDVLMAFIRQCADEKPCYGSGFPVGSPHEHPC